MYVGVGYRRELSTWIHSYPDELSCLEITAEHFFDSNQGKLDSLSENYPVYVHGLGLSLGTEGKLDQKYLNKFSAICEQVDAKWVSEHIAFTRTKDIDLGHLNPIPFTDKSLRNMINHVNEVSDKCQRQVILENITSHLTLPGSMSETDFINRLCDETGCGFLLDVTNLYVNSRNHDYDPVEWLNNIEAENIVQLHVVGYSRNNERYEDYHAESIQDDLWQLIDKVITYAPVQAVIIERDNNFPSNNELARELNLLASINE